MSYEDIIIVLWATAFAVWLVWWLLPTPGSSFIKPQKLDKGEKVPSGMVNTVGLSKAEVLAALYNVSAPSNMGFLGAGDGPKVMTVKEAQKLLCERLPNLQFDYLYGRPTKAYLFENGWFNPRPFDEYNGGEGSAQKVINRLRETGDVNPPESKQANITATQRNARGVMAGASLLSIRGGKDADELAEHAEKAVEHELKRQGQ